MTLKRSHEKALLEVNLFQGLVFQSYNCLPSLKTMIYTPSDCLHHTILLTQGGELIPRELIGSEKGCEQFKTSLCHQKGQKQDQKELEFSTSIMRRLMKDF